MEYEEVPSHTTEYCLKVGNGFVKLCEENQCLADITSYYSKSCNYITPAKYVEAFLVAYDKGPKGRDQDICNWMLNPEQMRRISIDFTYYSMMEQYLVLNRQDVFLWNAVWHFNRKTFRELYSETSIFELCCLFGEKDLAEWFMKHYTINISSYLLSNCISRCSQKALEMAMWLDSLSPVNETTIYEVFRCACHNPDIAAWVYDKYCNLIHAKLTQYEINTIFGEALMNSLDMAKWLHMMFPDVRLYTYSFAIICGKGEVSTVEWVLQTFPDIDVTDDNCYAFVSACDHKQFKIVDILLEKNCAAIIANKYAQRYLKHAILATVGAEINSICYKHDISYTIVENEDQYGIYKTVEFR
jgi:hypothetical protein